jgi:hypothetical protein
LIPHVGHLGDIVEDLEFEICLAETLFLDDRGLPEAGVRERVFELLGKRCREAIPCLDAYRPVDSVAIG